MTNYELEVAAKAELGQDLKFFKNTACGEKIDNELLVAAENGVKLDDTHQFQCSIDMTLLSEAPYNLKMGDMIYYRIRAKNLVGWGDFSQPQLNPKRMVTKPGLPLTPKIDQLGKDGFRVCW